MEIKKEDDLGIKEITLTQDTWLDTCLTIGLKYSLVNAKKKKKMKWPKERRVIQGRILSKTHANLELSRIVDVCWQRKI